MNKYKHAIKILEEVAEKCRGKYCDNDNNDFLYDTYEYIAYNLKILKERGTE